MMKRSSLYFALLCIVFTSCKSEWEEANEKIVVAKNETSQGQEMTKYVSIEAFEDGNNIAEYNVRVELSQTKIGQDSIWVVSDLNEGISKKAGFYFYSSPEKVKYIRTDYGYDIQLTLECQLTKLDAQLRELGKEEIGFVRTYDLLNDNESKGANSSSNVQFEGKGTNCVKGNYVRLVKTIYIQQENTQLIIEQDQLEVTTLPRYGWSNFNFLETNNLPKLLNFEKSSGYIPIFESSVNDKGEKSEIHSKYDSSGVFK